MAGVAASRIRSLRLLASWVVTKRFERCARRQHDNSCPRPQVDGLLIGGKHRRPRPGWVHRQHMDVALTKQCKDRFGSGGIVRNPDGGDHAVADRDPGLDHGVADHAARDGTSGTIPEEPEQPDSVNHHQDDHRDDQRDRSLGQVLVGQHERDPNSAITTGGPR